MRRTSFAALIIGIVAAIAACSSTDTTSPSTGGHSNTITASSTTTGGAYGSGGNYFFSPTPDTVAAGTSVTWMFGSVTHNVHFDAAPMATASIPASTNTSVARTLSAPGTYTYHCTIHGISGTVVAQ